MKRFCFIIFLFLVSYTMGQEPYFVSDGIVYNITSESNSTVEVTSYQHMLNSPYSGTITIPQTVTNNGITYTVTALGESAFEGCTGVTSLNLPASVRSFGSYCFYNCNFTSLQLPDSLRVIGDHAFLYSNVTTLHLPASFEGYDDAAFWARNLTSITVDEGNTHYHSNGGCLYSKDSLTLCIVPSGKAGAITVPSFVRHIGRQAFGFCSRVTSVSLPEGLTSIGDFAFNVCQTVNNIVIPTTVTRIGLCPFSYCPQLTNLTIASGNTHYVMDGLMLYSADFDTLVSCHKSGVTVMLNPNVKVVGGFENNTWLRNIDIPAGVTDILDNCFNGCAFSNIALPAHMNRIGALAFAENSNLANVTMPETLLSMGDGAFSWCTNLTYITIPDSFRVIPKEAFNSCPRLGTITWGNAVEKIGHAAFWAMAADHLDLPPTLKTVDDLAFAACDNNLRTVTIHSQLDTMGEGVFRAAQLDYLRFRTGSAPTVKGNGPLDGIGKVDIVYIPCGADGTWWTDSYWSQFADKYHEDCDGINPSDDCAVFVYPNPATKSLTVVGSDSRNKLELINSNGQTVLSEAASGSHTEIDVRHLGRGFYILRINTPDSTHTRKVILK